MGWLRQVNEDWMTGVVGNNCLLGRILRDEMISLVGVVMSWAGFPDSDGGFGQLLYGTYILQPEKEELISFKTYSDLEKNRLCDHPVKSRLDW